MKELVEIQRKLKAPKSRYNSFGKYNYRSCEDILEAVKDLLAEQNCQLTLSDEVTEVAGRVYIKATAKLTNPEGEVVITAAYAREDEKRSGIVDSAQITGSSSSYARKYALNGLFAIDDSKDIDGEAGANGIETKLDDGTITKLTFEEVEHAVMNCASTQELTTLCRKHPEWQGYKDVMNVFTRRKNELNGNGKTK